MNDISILEVPRGWKRTGIWGNFWISPEGIEYKEEDGFNIQEYYKTKKIINESQEMSKNPLP